MLFRSQIGKLGQQGSNALTHLMPMKNHVDGAMLQQELAALETFGQLFTNSLLDNTRTGETDQRIRFRNVQIAQMARLAETPPNTGSVMTEI